MIEKMRYCVDQKDSRAAVESLLGVGRTSDSRRSARFRRCAWLLALILAIVLMLLLAACSREGVAGRADRAVPSVTEAITEDVPLTPADTGLPIAPAPTVAPTAVTPPAPLAAMVDGQYIFLADYERQVVQYEQALLEQGLDPESEEGRSDLALMHAEVLESLIDSVLIEQAAIDMGLGLSDQELEAEIEVDIAAGGGEAAFEEWLEVTGLTREDYEKMLRDSLYAQRILDSLPDDIPQAAEQIHARQIVVESEQVAQDIVALLREGADFGDLAREYSVDLATKDEGGELGWFPRGWLTAELEEAAFALPAGQVSGVIPLSDRYHVIQIVERETQRQLSDEVIFDLKLEAFERWLEAQRSAAAIERYAIE